MYDIKYDIVFNVMPGDTGGMKRLFIETNIFKQLLDQENDKTLELRIKSDLLENPERGEVIKGAGGLRKFRVSDKSRGKGKRGGHRVILRI